MPANDHPRPSPPPLVPSMTDEYSRISETARAVDLFAVPATRSYLDSAKEAIAGMPPGTPFVIADYGAADGVNSSHLVETIVRHLRELNPSVAVRLVYVDVADPAPFERFWAGSPLAAMDGITAEYIQRSFYEPFPELAGCVHLGISSTALHWLDTRAVEPGLFRNPGCIQANQLSVFGSERFAKKWKGDFRAFLVERSHELVGGGLLFMANLACLGSGRWPASAGYDTLRDVIHALYREGRISKGELEAVFIPDYFATPDEMRDVLDEDAVRRDFSLLFFDAVTVPCAYYSRMHETLEDAGERRQLAETLAGVVRAGSESSIRAGMSGRDDDIVDEIYRRLADRFFETPRGLPYQYCLVELVRKVDPPA